MLGGMGKPRQNQLQPITLRSGHSTADQSSHTEPAERTPAAPEGALTAEILAPARGEAGLHRREFLTRGAKTIAFLAAFQAYHGAQEAIAALGFDPFSYGVASGDPLPNRVIIWTRVNPTATATPGSGLGSPVRGIWEVARDAAFTQRVAFGQFTTALASDHTVKIDVSGLQPSTPYYYRFNALGVNSPVGRTLTAPAAGSNPASVRFGLVSCSNFEAGYFTAYRHLSQRDDLDFILHVGDYIYEYANGQYGPAGFAGVSRVHDPATEILSLSDYRRRHACYKADADLRGLHQRYSFIATWDDHESANNSWRDGAENHQPGTEGAWAARKAAAAQAYFEWMPIRPPAATGAAGEVRPLYRKFSFGSLIDLFMLDLRQYRDEQPTSPADSAAIYSPSRTILGSVEGQWLQQNLLTTTAQWKLMGNSVQIAPIIVIPSLLPPETAQVIQAVFGVPATATTPTPINIDSWDGYNTSRTQVLGLIAGAVTGQPIRNCVFLTGDIHSSYACDLPANPSTYSSTPVSLATEFVCTSVTSDNVNEILGAPERVPNGQGGYVRYPGSAGFEQLVRSFNAWVRDVNLDYHGFCVVDVTSTRTQVDNWVIRSDASAAFAADPRIDPNAYAVFLSAALTVADSQRVTTGASQLGPRP